jgi:hypothetical protein
MNKLDDNEHIDSRNTKYEPGLLRLTNVSIVMQTPCVRTQNNDQQVG